MHQEVFKAGFFSLFNLIFIGVFVFFYVTQGISLILLVFIAIWILIVIATAMQKVTIENDILSYRSVFKRREISLHEVGHIVTRVEISTDSDGERSSKQVVYVLDESGRTYFSFSGNLMTRKNQERFRKAVTAVNPNIEIFLR